MKKLRQFLRFDFEAFGKDKVFAVTGIGPWADFDTKEHLGTKVEVAIVEDKTPYQHKDGEVVTNAFEKLTFKVAKDGVTFPVGTRVVPVGVSATVYGDYMNKLSVKCQDVRPVTKQP